MLQNISKKLVFERIRFENPWWTTQQIAADYNQYPKRLYLKLFKPLVLQQAIRRAVVLMGPRRVGKTVMLHHLIQEMIVSGINPLKIIFITIENPIYNNIPLEQLFAYAKEANGLNDTNGWYIFLDEIQYCKDWEVHLKTLVDSYRQDKFIASGSAAAALKFASNESGAGRFTDFLLPPLTFGEYIAFKGLNRLMQQSESPWPNDLSPAYTTNNLMELNEHFINYINFGGYPEVIFSSSIQANMGQYIRSDIIDKVLLRDLPSLYGIANTTELNSLFVTIAYNSGSECSLEALSQQSNIPKNTLKKYIDYLEAAYLIKRVKRIDQSGKKFKRDNFFKIYLTNTSLRSALFTPITATAEMIGSIVETAIFSQWMHRDTFSPWYARWQTGEVDLVGLNTMLKPIWAVEIKWSDQAFNNPKKLKNLLKFCQNNAIKNAVVTSINKEGFKEVQGINLQFMPAAVYAYNVSQRTLNDKISGI